MPISVVCLQRRERARAADRKKQKHLQMKTPRLEQENFYRNKT